MKRVTENIPGSYVKGQWPWSLGIHNPKMENPKMVENMMESQTLLKEQCNSGLRDVKWCMER